MDMARFKQELTSDTIKHIVEEPSLRVADVGTILELKFKFETLGGRSFERKFIVLLDKAKNLPDKEEELRVKAYEAAIVAIGSP